MRDYTRLPGYGDMTNLDARHNYLHELLERWCGGGRACMSCSVPEKLGAAHTKCCPWLCESKPDKAILLLEDKLGIDNYDEQALLQRITDYNGTHNVMDLVQEECGELVQAISKLRRAKNDAARAVALAKVVEELADVSVVLDELCLALGTGARAKSMRRAKITRTVERYDIKEE